MFFVYIIEALKSKRYYIGQTENLEERIKRHNQGRNLSTKAYIPWRVKWWKEYGKRSEAVKVESKLKRIKKRIGIEKFVIDNGFSGCGAVGPVTHGVTRILEKSENQRFSIFRD